MDPVTLKLAKNYTDKQLEPHKVKIAEVDKELSDFQRTLASVNVNQEAKQSVTGYGMVSLPKNASNGQVSASLKGVTRTNLLGDAGDFEDLTKWTLQNFSGVGTFELNSTKKMFGNNSLKLSITSGILWRYKELQGLEPTKHYELTVYVNIESYTSGQIRLAIYDNGGFSNGQNVQPDYNTKNQWQRIKLKFTGRDNIRIAVGSGISSELVAYYDGAMLREITQIEYNDANNITPNYINGTKSTVSAIRLKSVDKDNKNPSFQYITAKDSEGKIVELRSLPNGTKDEVRVGEKRLIKRTENQTLAEINIESLVTGSNTQVILLTYPNSSLLPGVNYVPTNLSSNYPYTTGDWNNVNNIGKIVFGNDRPRLVFALGTFANVTSAKNWLQANPIELTYQLATPVEIPIEVSGTLLSYPSGTVWLENAVADAGIYTDKFTVLQQDLPIKEIEKISKVDFTTGIETELDVSQAVISTDKLSFTHPSLTENDIVFTTYFYDLESTQGELTVEYYDSRYVLKDSVTGKYYKVVQTVANGVLSQTLVEV